MSKRGFIIVARGVHNHPIVGARKPYSDFEAWLWLLFEAAWKPRRVTVSNGRALEVIELQRGQLSHSLRFMAAAWGWSVKRVRTFLRRLEMDNQVTTQTGTLQTFVSVCNYDLYQTPQGREETQTGTQTGTQRKRNGHKEEQGNKVIKESTRSGSRSDEPEGFTEWYDAYPKKRQRKDAVRAYRRLVPREISHADLMARTVGFANFHKRNTPAHRWQYVPYPASWLNSGEYLDPLPNDALKSGAQQGEIKIDPPDRDPKTFSDEEWRQRLTDYRRGQRWPDLYWGPPPGSPGCLVPAKLLIEQAPKIPLVAEDGHS